MRKQKALIITTLALVLSTTFVYAQSAEMAATMMRIWKDAASGPPRWTYDQGVILEGIAGLWKNTGDGKYFEYIRQSMDAFVDDQGNIRTYKEEDYNIDNVKNGRTLLLLYQVTNEEKYKKGGGPSASAAA